MVCTHQPVPLEWRNCYGRWPGSRAMSRCSSMTLECPHNGHSCSWLGPHTHSHLYNQQINSEFKSILPVGWQIGEETSLLTCYCRHHTLLLVGIWSPGPLTIAVEGPFGVDALTMSAQRLVVAFIHIWGLTSNNKEQHKPDMKDPKNFLHCVSNHLPMHSRRLPS